MDEMLNCMMNLLPFQNICSLNRTLILNSHLCVLHLHCFGVNTSRCLNGMGFQIFILHPAQPVKWPRKMYFEETKQTTKGL